MGPVLSLYFANTFRNISSTNTKAKHKIKKVRLVLFCLFLFTGSNYYAQYAPLKLGNVWVLESNDGTRGRVEIIDSSVIIDTIEYFGYAFAYQSSNSGFIRLRNDDFYVVREDSTFPTPNNERIYYKKNARLGDTWQLGATYTITDTFPAYTFDTLVTGKLLNEDFGLVEWDYVWTEEFGRLAKLNWLGEVQNYLRGCVINGIVYGDTAFIVSSVDDIISTLSYELFQNYPNPFNSSTILTYTIPEGDYVLLEVFNSLGEKVDILVDDFIPAGKHSVMFIADKLSSGVYIYSLSTSSFRETKKMLLLR
ncbi:MAG: T9SS type A sorting domain-containing protein [Bacteroidetes bacterium]|nr:T9SS type A sorting domain-containing protein [Bacteroidota bacterium]